MADAFLILSYYFARSAFPNQFKKFPYRTKVKPVFEGLNHFKLLSNDITTPDSSVLVVIPGISDMSRLTNLKASLLQLWQSSSANCLFGHSLIANSRNAVFFRAVMAQNKIIKLLIVAVSIVKVRGRFVLPKLIVHAKHQL